MLPLIGVWGRRGDYTPAQRALFDKVLKQRRRYGGPYYTLAWAYTSHLMQVLGRDGLMQVARATDPDAEARRLTGRGLDAHRREWLAALRRGHALADAR